MKTATRPSALLWLVLLVLGAVLFWPLRTIGTVPSQAMTPERGYKAAVDVMVERGCLAQIEKGGRRLIAFRDGKNCPPRAQFDAYRANSFLRGDMASLIGQRWQYGGNGPELALTGIRTNAHTLRYSAQERATWGGSVAYAPGSGEVRSGQFWASRNGLRGPAPDCAGAAKLHALVACKDGILWQRVERIGAMSEITGSAERVREPTLAGAVQRLEAANMSGDVQSSIRHDLHFAVQALLESHLENAASQPGKQEKTVRAGVLLMDGLSGEIHGAATHPASADDIGSDGRSNWLHKNWNFERLAIGSAAKIPFAAAIMDANPDLMTAKVRPSIRFCGGIAKCVQRAGEGLPVNFTQFITQSSNGYALWLIDQAYRGRANGWQDAMRRLSCAEPDTGKRDPSCASHLWREEDGLLGDERPLGNSEALLEMKMGASRPPQLFNSFHVAILGAGPSTWTSANLAQAYARIFSGRAVNPRLTPGDPAKQGSAPLNPAVWRAIRTGMAGALATGTGKQICAALRCTLGHKYGTMWLYAKTGTATIGTSKGDDSKTLVLIAITTASGAEPANPEQIIGMKMIVITQRYNAAGRGANDLAVTVLRDPAVKAWLGQRDLPPAKSKAKPKAKPKLGQNPA